MASSPTPPEGRPHVGTDFEALLAAARAGDDLACNTLVRRFEVDVGRAVHRALRCEVRPRRPWLSSLFSTGDIVQDVLWRVIRNLDDVDGCDERAFGSYLATSVRNRIVDMIRFHEADCRDPRRAVGHDHITHVDPGGNPAWSAATREQCDRVQAVLRTFEVRDQRLLSGRLEQAVSYRDLAATLGYGSEDAARKAFYVAHARLLVRLRAVGIAPTEGP